MGCRPLAEGAPAKLADTTPELDDSERRALSAELKQIIAADRFPLSPRIRKLQAILDKLDPPAARPQPHPAPKPPGEPSAMLQRMRGPRRRR